MEYKSELGKWCVTLYLHMADDTCPGGGQDLLYKMVGAFDCDLSEGLNNY